MKKTYLTVTVALFISSCSPLKTSQHDERYQWELTLHEVQTNLDDLRHDINCFKTELQILDGKIKFFDQAVSSLKQHDLEKHQAKIDQLLNQIQSLEKKMVSCDKMQQNDSKELQELLAHANETTAALTQFKGRIQELEGEILTQNKKFDELSKLKGRLESLSNSKGRRAESVKVYKVRPGDSLEKIARSHKTAVEQIKKLNDLDQDLIVVGQELKIPSE